MAKQLKKATTVFSIKKATINGNEKKFNDKILNNDIGKEYIIVIAPQKYQHGSGVARNIRNYYKNDAGANGKFMFVHQGLRRVKMNQEFCFNWTILMYTFGYTDSQINKTKEAFEKLAPDCNFVKISRYQEAVNYINTIDKSKNTDDKKLREKKLVERIFIYCHGFVGKLAMGLTNRSSGDTDLDWDESVVSKLKESAFSKTAKIYSFSCRTGLGNPEIDESIYKKKIKSSTHIGTSTPGIPIFHDEYETIKLPLLSAKSLAQKFANTTGAITYAYCSRSDYEDTLNTPDELDFMEYYEAGEGKKPARQNDSYKYLLDKKNRKSEDVKRYDTLSNIDKERVLIDGGRFDAKGARYPVKGGTTPVGVPNDMKTYQKK